MVAVPVKTPISAPVTITIVKQPNGGSWLRPSGNGIDEDDNQSDFALTP